MKPKYPTAREVAYARRRRRGWTKWRPFLSADEQIGAARCGKHPNRQSVEVSYSLDLPGRVVRCHECTQAPRALTYAPSHDKMKENAR